MKISLRRQYKVRINYKSSNSVECWFWKFKSVMPNIGEGVERMYSWVSAPGNKPITFNIEHIESVWQIDMRWRIYVGNDEENSK